MKKRILLPLAMLAWLGQGCSVDKSVSGLSSSSSSSSSANQCTSPSTTIVDYGMRRTSGAALNVRGAFSDLKLIPGTNYPAVAYNETNTTAGVTTLKYQYWNGTDFMIETVAGGLTNSFISLAFLNTGRPLIFWGNGATALYMAARSTASTSTSGTWTVTVIDGTSTAIRAIEASVSPSDQVLVSFTGNTTTTFVKASLCTSNCHLAANYTAMTNSLDAAAGTAMNQMGVGWCKHSAGYYPLVLYGGSATSVLTSCRNATLSNCSDGSNWTTDVVLTGSSANASSQQLYVDSSTTDATVYMGVRSTTGIRPYTFASCATSVAVTSADPGTNYISNTATVGNAWFNLGFGSGYFHVIANDAQTMVKYFNQTLAAFATTTWNTTAAPHVETTGAAGIAATGLTRGGMAIDTTADQVLLSYGRTLAVTPTQSFANLVLAYNDCPAGLGSPVCASTTLASDASSTGMYWGNSPNDSTGQIQRNILQVPSLAVAATSTGRPAAVYVDYSVGVSAEPVTGALLKYAYRDGSSATDKWNKVIISSASAPMGPGLAFDHLDRPWISWYESATGTGGFRYYMATNTRSDGDGHWSVYAFPLSDAAAGTLPAMNQTAMTMYYSGGVAKPVMVVLRNPAASKGVHAAKFDPVTGQWDHQKQLISLTGTTTPGGAWLSADYDTSGNIIVAVHDLGTGASSTCTPNTARCIQTSYSTNGGQTWSTAGQIYSGAAEGLNIKLNPSNNRPAVAFFNRALNQVRYKYCSTALASCSSSSNWADIDTGVVDALGGVSGLTDNGAAANAGLLNIGLSFSSDGYPWVTWPRGAGATVSANLMFSALSSSTGLFSTASNLKVNSIGNESLPVAANAGNFGLSWNPQSVRTSTGSMHTVYVGPGNFLYATSCGN